MATAAQILSQMQNEKAVSDILNSAALKSMLGSNAAKNTQIQTDPLALARALGLDYNLGNITNTYTRAADAGNALLEQQYRDAVTAFFQSLGAQGAATMNALRRAQAGANASNATAGTAAANQLSALLGLTQGSSGDALKVAQQGVEVGKQMSADKAAAIRDALTAYNALGTQLGGLQNDANAVIAQNIASYAGLGQSAVGAQSAANDRTANIGMHENEMINNIEVANLAKLAQENAAAKQANATKEAAKYTSGYASNADQLKSTQDALKAAQAELDKLKKKQPQGPKQSWIDSFINDYTAPSLRK